VPSGERARYAAGRADEWGQFAQAHAKGETYDTRDLFRGPEENIVRSRIGYHLAARDSHEAAANHYLTIAEMNQHNPNHPSLRRAALAHIYASFIHHQAAEALRD
jgi:hypothetical protein